MKKEVYLIARDFMMSGKLYYACVTEFTLEESEARLFKTREQAEYHLELIKEQSRYSLEHVAFVNPDELFITSLILDVEEYLSFPF